MALRCLLCATGMIGALTVLTTPSSASTESAWEDFRADVADQCTAAAQATLRDIRVRVDPLGSSDYGLALIDGVAERADTRSQVICIYDKQDKTVELGTPLDAITPDRSAP